MRRFNVLRCVPILVAALCATGCGAEQSGVASTTIPPKTSVTTLSGARPTKTWVFVSDPGTSQLFVYDLPKLHLVQIVTGFTQPLGECSDNKGDVWVTDGSAKTIYKLLHSGKVVDQLSDTSGYPDGCAWDPKTGNLAVTNILGGNSQSGAVLVYHRASGTPNVYYNRKQWYYNFAGYDDSGNLFFDGRDVRGKFILSELAVDANQAKTETISGGQLYEPGMVEWDSASNELVVGDQSCSNQQASCVYRMTIRKSAAAIVGMTPLQNSSGGAVCDLIQGVLWKNAVVGSDFNICGSKSSATYVWPYPTGGLPSSSKAGDASQPFGAAISTASGDDR